MSNAEKITGATREHRARRPVTSDVFTDTIVIGAGPAGLAVGAVLRRANVPFVMLERADRIGASWHRHYDRLHLHTPKSHSALPYRAYPRTYPRYPSRQQFVEYLDDYARTFELEPELGRDVQRISRGVDGAWDVATNAGDYYARRVVIATGYNRAPNVPRWPGQESFPGCRITHRCSTHTDRAPTAHRTPCSARSSAISAPELTKPTTSTRLPRNGRPRASGRETVVPGRYFCGYDLSSTGMLRQIGIEAMAIGRDIASRPLTETFQD